MRVLFSAGFSYKRKKCNGPEGLRTLDLPVISRTRYQAAPRALLYVWLVFVVYLKLSLDDGVFFFGLF